ncbi:DUF115 domain-containing protein [Campylobacter sp. MIT 21-1685]|uniref:motility associated factor glycosyltransferase family protein n=1 Tax=unclassified Campylobacter TaxID=2593542 RepID=UPI00224AFA03|nr:MULTISPECIES: 6-hydroxymethylpterin diphosphokinase MptE-like protein [unclassified Campylobacter]MCX2683730.1 DUF115 domain-containing protein [Campylobacter sp. MIT 21-1684]MCX2752006.1 DUF115 domain-containing protein [Campylobacter sp. MIT 21-1682]MCX2808211.1 DUF115 domain-containing protein [Campylobacter sp. MIT 21-1685]
MNFENNLQALNDTNKAQFLKQFKHSNSFELIQNEQGLNYRYQNGAKLYENPNDELLQYLDNYEKHYKYYPTLFFYGFGSGLLYKTLLEKEHIKHLVVFEEHLELLALAFHLFDFSTWLLSKKLIILTDCTQSTFEKLFSVELIQKSVRIYTLQIHSTFYEKSTLLQEFHKKMIQNIQFLVLSKGNDPKDSLIGIENTLGNLDTMLDTLPFKQFIARQRFQNPTAIIVSTGPSLTKQLTTLKEVQEKAVIFCADSAYSILAKNGIVPDYVLSIERLALSSEFFCKDYGNTKTFFILSSLTHKNSRIYLKQQKKQFLLVLRPFYFESKLDLDDFGYLGVGASVANMAYELAAALRHKNIIFIGQDLAYSKEGLSHSKEYENLALHKGDFERDYENFRTLGYGGGHFVQSSLVWNLFREGLQRDIFLAKEKLHITTYNCTEGGARIEGTIEKPFKKICKEILNKKKNIVREDFHCKDKEVFKKRVMQKLQNMFSQAKTFLIEFTHILEQTTQELSKHKPDTKALQHYEKQLDTLSTSLYHHNFYTEVFTALCFHFECQSIKLEALNTNIFETLTEKIRYYKEIQSALKAQNEIIENFLRTENGQRTF